MHAATQTIAVTLGALAPDLTMLAFYLAMKISGVPEFEIWDVRYFEPVWQHSFDIANSIPVYALLALAAWRLGSRSSLLFCVAALVHCVLDLLVHHDDGHRHFYPFTDFRFQSPVSYWDPAHYGRLVGFVEILSFAGIAVWLWRSESGISRQDRITKVRFLTPLRTVILLTFSAYAGYLTFVAIYWSAPA